ncbi:hypothetical protein Tco_0777713 [Tanacetum coccineum]
MLSLRERMELDLEVRLMGETLVLNRPLDPISGDYIELNDLNVSLELRRDQVNDLLPTIKEGKVTEEFRARNDAIISGYPSDFDHDKKIRIDCAYNLKFSCMIDFAVLEDMDNYRDEEMGDVIFGEPFLREVGINVRRFNGMITIYMVMMRVLYKVEDIATCLVKVCKVWDDLEVDRYGNANLVIMEYLVKINQKARILELKRRHFEDYYSDIQYVFPILVLVYVTMINYGTYRIRTRASMKLPMLMMSFVVFDFKSALQHESSL